MNLSEIKTRIKNNLRILFMSGFIYKYDEDWDKKINTLMDSHSFEPPKFNTDCVVCLGGHEIWVNHYPWSYASDWSKHESRVRPSRKTILRVHDKLAEDKKEWGKPKPNIPPSVSQIAKYSAYALGSSLNSIITASLNSNIPSTSLNYRIKMMSLAASQPIQPIIPEAYEDLKTKIEALQTKSAVKVQKPMPDYTHTLTGWRGWIVQNGVLKALGMSGVWTPKKITAAECLNKANHACPSSACSCGYWSFKTLENLTEVLSGYTNSVQVIGSVEVWGKVIDCEKGFRSEFAYPKELWLLDNEYEFLGPLYGVPIRRM